LLLFGISWPIWAVHSSSDIRGLSGLGALGVGDAMASVVGVLVSNTETQGKTFAGWAANFLSTFAFYTCLNELGFFSPVRSFMAILVVSLISSLVEAWVAINDNLVLPLVTFIAWQVQGTI
jgi:dolichol kinase